MQLDQSEIDALMAEASELADQAADQPVESAPSQQSPPAEQRRPPLDTANWPPRLQRILKLEVPVIVQLAERDMKMQEVLDLNIGSIIEFDKRFDSELELIVTDRQIGFGHAVKVGENFGLRITRIGSIYETIRALGSSSVCKPN